MEPRVSTVPVRLVDCDVHPTVPEGELPEYVPEPWRSLYYSRAGAVEPIPMILTPPLQVSRADAESPSGAPPGADPAFVDRQLLVEEGIDIAILITLNPRAKANPEHEQAVCAANNAWLADTWLSRYNRHGRYRAAIRVCPLDPAGAVREIERWAGHPGFVEVAMAPESMAPFGQPQFHPIYEAAERHGLPVALHVTRAPGMRILTPAGFPTYYLEEFPGIALRYIGHLVSLVFEGVFERFDGLRVVLVEGGYTWLPPLLWRLDRHWEALRRELPHVKRRPSDTVRERVRFTTQPLEEPHRAEHLLTLTEWAAARETLLFATDYPHYDFDAPRTVTPRLPRDVRERVLFGNALELYGFPSDRPRDHLDDARDAAEARA
jgi:predicted TIM-barrel fold metal-dependent hydrolase